jgi:hypothetical protein
VQRGGYERGEMDVSKLVCWILLALALAACVHDSNDAPVDAPVDCVHRTFGCDMNGRPL